MQIDDDINSCIKVLNEGGLILYPTDTEWGIGCDATNEIAVDNIYRLKKRNKNNTLIILLADEKDIPKYTDQNNLNIYDYIKGVDKPTTVIYNNAKNIALNLINADGSIGIKIVKDAFCKKLISRFGKPIVSTSSNLSGYPPPMFFSDIDYEIISEVDYAVWHRREEQVPGEPSTVVKINSDGTYVVIKL